VYRDFNQKSILSRLRVSGTAHAQLGQLKGNSTSFQITESLQGTPPTESWFGFLTGTARKTARLPQKFSCAEKRKRDCPWQATGQVGGGFPVALSLSLSLVPTSSHPI